MTVDLGWMLLGMVLAVVFVRVFEYLCTRNAYRD